MAVALILALGHAGACDAQANPLSDIFSPDSFHGLAEVRAAAADGERSWLDGGFGKTSVSGDGPALKATQAALEWKPAFTFALSGDVTLLAQSGVPPAVD